MPVVRLLQRSYFMLLKTKKQLLEKDEQGFLFWKALIKEEEFFPGKCAVIICDMWDRHWSPAATLRAAAMAPVLNGYIAAMRDEGMTIIHCPSETLDFYEGHPARIRMNKILDYCTKKQLREVKRKVRAAKYPSHPLDARRGGCDTGGRTPKNYLVWSRQNADIYIDGDRDFIGEKYAEVYNIMKHRDLDTLIYTGVHTNMCVIGREFGMKNMAQSGFKVYIAANATDAMYCPADRPYVSHERGVEMCVEYIEKFIGESVF